MFQKQDTLFVLELKANEVVFIHSREFKSFRECMVYLWQEHYTPFLEVYLIENINVTFTIAITVNGLWGKYLISHMNFQIDINQERQTGMWLLQLWRHLNL